VIKVNQAPHQSVTVGTTQVRRRKGRGRRRRTGREGRRGRTRGRGRKEERGRGVNGVEE
jgi:hypothetical protein